MPVALLTPLAANAATPVYQLTGTWLNPPAQTQRGDLLASEWHLNVNDSVNPPSNAPVDNVTFSATVASGVFASLPSICSGTGSAISADGSTLTCNVGTRNMGTAVVVQTPVRVTGNTGSAVSIAGSVGGVKAALPPIPIKNTFGIDMVWGQPTPWNDLGGGFRYTNFPFTLNLLKGSDAGPDSVTYHLTLDTLTGATPGMGVMATQRYQNGASCFPYDPGSGGADLHPFSAGASPAQTAPFVKSCTLVQTGPTTYTMTLTGIDYSLRQVPTLDSTGKALPAGQVAVASGLIGFQWPLTNSDAVTLRLTGDSPTYTAATGVVAQDDPSNNVETKVIPPIGGFAAGWDRGYSHSGGSYWDDNYRVSPGSTVQSAAWTKDFGNGQPIAPTAMVGVCQFIDNRYVTYQDSQILTQGGAILDTTGMSLEYYVGAADAADPNALSCNQGGADPGATGWTTTLPTDLSAVRGVRVQAPMSLMQQRMTAEVDIHIHATVNSNVATGQDVWTFGSERTGGSSWVDPGRDTNGSGFTPTPNAQYPYTTGTRDIFRVVAAVGNIAKSASPSTLKGGDQVTYTLTYSAARYGAPAGTTLDGVVITDTLPTGLTYVAGSASPEPQVNGQVLTWTLNGVPYNADQALTYKATVPATAVPGSVLTNNVGLKVPGDNRDPATTPGLNAHADVTVATDAVTVIGKVADSPFIPNPDGTGNGPGSWTVTLKSQDAQPQSYTDIIDVLPYNGDGRGTTFSGTYQVTDVLPDASGGTVYYSSAAPGGLSDDPADPSNGAANSVAGNTVGWTTTKPANVTAIRVIAGTLNPGAIRTFQVKIATQGAKGYDQYVNRAQGRASHTQLVMRTSATLTIAPYNSASLKKYVQDKQGVWHDANDPSDYPTFAVGDTVVFRLVITNTGQGTLTNIVVKDDLYADCGFTVASLAPGEEKSNECTRQAVKGTTVNTASATTDVPPVGPPPVIPPDPAGYTAYPKPVLTVQKTSDPVSGSEVKGGDSIKYTVTATNASQDKDAVLTTVTLTDDLSKVLNSASLVQGSLVATLDGQPVAAPAVTGTTLSWTGGPLAMGKSVVLTYQVTVNADVAPNSTLLNAVVGHGTSPGGKVDSNCMPGGNDPRCFTTQNTPGVLASTGSEVLVPLALAGILILSGGLTVMATRSRWTARRVR
ncbi:isopeptide-forming domain-containing fimbrial protein [Psychromicrobium xiongbiense]|uniref:isopeptide-forming domain-containing fimbrial protein n=1 Tax=Psychromicrobium xiongbiense TaxID=3051184 RepID=UPI002552BDAC|nr:isopeptide-forming domain-containing fimbrial protein [Psychromicrobium sp. YIM S02556]